MTLFTIKTKRSKTTWILGGLIVVLIFIVAIGGIFRGVMTWQMQEVSQENNFESRTVSVETVENFPDKTVTPNTSKTKVAFKNTGSDSAFVRVAYAENWETSTALLEGNQHAEKLWTSEWRSQWVDGGDGWYYYRKVLPAGATTDKILNAVKFDADVPAASYKLNFIVETVQVSDEQAVNADATQKLFGKSSVLSGTIIENGAVVAGTVRWD